MVNLQSQRFYWMTAKQDLFNTWCVHKIFGGLQNNHRQTILIPCESEFSAYTLLNECERTRLKRGYKYSELNNPDHYFLKPQTIDEILSTDKING
jgi:hypothetical protein